VAEDSLILLVLVGGALTLHDSVVFQCQLQFVGWTGELIVRTIATDLTETLNTLDERFSTIQCKFEQQTGDNSEVEEYNQKREEKTNTVNNASPCDDAK
jgi:hypothetical protein